MSSYHSHHTRSEKYEIQIPKPSSALVYGGLLTFIGGVILLIAFASPYWLASFEDTRTETAFNNMGLWEYCFDDYRHPNYQFDKLFTGCHYVYSKEYHIIREWLLPGWMLAVQTFFTLAFMASLATQILLASLVVRWPLGLVIQNEWILTFISCLGNATAAFMILLSISIFGANYDRRDWLQYPNYNYLSWSYAFAVGTMFVHGLAAIALYVDSKEAKERVIEGEGHLALQMHPTGPASTVGGMSNPGSEAQHYM